MTRTIKALGLAMLAALALSAMAASAAQAEGDLGFTGTFENAILTGETVKAEKHKDHIFTGAGERKITCEVAKFDGTTSKAGDKEIKVTPTYEKCTGFGVLPVTVTHNGCEYRFYDFTKIIVDKYSYKVDLVCPEGKKIEVHVYKNEEEEKKGISTCTLTFGSQNNIPQEGEENYAENTTKGNFEDDIDLTTTLKGIKYTTDENSDLLVCGAAGVSEAGKYTGSTTVKGYEDLSSSGEYGVEGNQIGIEITGE